MSKYANNIKLYYLLIINIILYNSAYILEFNQGIKTILIKKIDNLTI
jgi:hypothetical protein